MKNTFKHILASVAFAAVSLSFGMTAFAQAVQYDKRVTPVPDENGVYTISMEAYVTGSITVTKTPAPADIVLVLDRSGSMAYNISGTQTSRVPAAEQRINILKSAVQGFVDNIRTSNGNIKTEDRDAYGGHRVAIVWFSGNSQDDANAVYTGIQGLNTFLNVENMTTTPASTSTWGNYSAAQVTYNNRNLLNVSADGGTITNIAMQRAGTILSGQDYSDKPKRSRIVVFFTDGDPGLYGRNDGWENHSDNLATANSCILAANGIKTSSTYAATIYSVGLFQKTEGTADATTTYLRYVSSDTSGKTEMPASSGYLPVSGDKSIVVSSSGALANVFASISQSAGGDYSASSSSSVLIDIVATSFKIPSDDLGTVRVYKDTCTQQSKTAMISFATTGGTGSVNITDKVTLTKDKTTGEVTVTGFDYGANWCGWNDEANGGAGGPHGNRLTLLIPIVVKEDAVGGPAVETNEPGSKLVIKDKDGNEIASYEFDKPTLKIPVNIWIQKTGLVEDDSAVFTLRRTPFIGADVDYSNSDIKWDKNWGTKVAVNKETMGADGIVKVSGLDPDYVYKIEEDAWGSFGYTYQSGGILYTVGDNAANPFKFVNIPKEVVFDEAVVRNVFKERKAGE